MEKSDLKFDITEELKKLPEVPGVYIMHDRSDGIIYVGKAVNLRNRVRQYFQSSRGKSAKIVRMVSQIERFEYIVTDSELEALVLENNLIKEHRPKYNTMLKDDKTYPYIRVTSGEPFPRVVLSRTMKKDDSQYFGPYSNGWAVKQTIETVRKLFGIRSCQKKLPSDKPERPCLYYYIGECPAPCTGEISLEEYRENVRHALAFLGGDMKNELQELREKMNAASEALEFEKAMEYRDLIGALEAIAEKQKITGQDMEDRDVIAIARDRTDAVVQVFFVRQGKLIGREHFYLRAAETDSDETVLESFVTQYYAGTPFIPHELMLSLPVPGQALLEEYLTARKGRRVRILVPQRGMKEKLTKMAEENAVMVLSRDRERIKREEGRTIGAVKEIAALLGMESIDRIEAYDISNISGADSVGSMIVFEKGKPKRTDYRKFRIRTVIGPDDYASMREVLTRRLSRAASASPGFERLPDLILMDGGRGQINIALSVLEELGISVPVAGMVKDDTHSTRGLYYNNVELPIDTSSEGFKLITRIQDEAHRFAIEYHRLLRSKGQVRSVLDEIDGIGPARRKALLRAFGSAEAVAQADADALAAVDTMNRRSAEAVVTFFEKMRQEREERTKGKDI